MQTYACNLLIMQNPESVAHEVAQRFACSAVRGVAEHGVFTVAIPGGSSPRRVFELLSSPDYSVIVPWAKIHVFFTDERYVPCDHEDSNFRQANDMLFSKVPIPAPNIHRFHTELPPDEDVAAYESDLNNFHGLDMVILGMGQDTHTASLFPNSPALSDQTHLATANYIKKLDSYRLTLTYSAINSAREILIIAMGDDKSEALQEALQSDPNPTLHPVQGIQPTYGKLLWVVDQAAAAKL